MKKEERSLLEEGNGEKERRKEERSLLHTFMSIPQAIFLVFKSESFLFKLIGVPSISVGSIPFMISSSSPFEDAILWSS
jgi:hypothetical protein